MIEWNSFNKDWINDWIMIESLFCWIWELLVGDTALACLVKKESYDSPAGISLLNINNRNTGTRCEICSKLTWCLYCYLWTYFTPFSSFSIVNFENVIADWELVSVSLLGISRNPQSDLQICAILLYTKKITNGVIREKDDK